MDHHRVECIECVLDEEFPIAGVLILQHATGDFDLPCRGAIHEIIERPRERPQPVGKTGAFRCDPGEDAAAAA